MGVKSLHVTLPEKLKEYVDLQTEQEGYSSKSDYVQQLIRNDMKHQELTKLKNLLLEGLTSGRKNYTQKEWQAFQDQVIKSVDA